VTATENICPFCGKAVQTTALRGSCPECMLKAGLTETGEVGPDGTVAAKAPPQPAPKVEEIAPHFPQLEILEWLGRGGMGAVYKARQPKLDRFVALKILTRRLDSGITDREFAARFQQEARALARLNHPDIVAVYDFGEAGGYHYLLMEFVDGLTLRQLLQTKRISPEEALAIVPKICEALQFAHERGIVHRDIKPENILIDKQGRVKIADFGIAKILGAQAPGRSLTGVKDVIGTPHYMAPEQVEKPAKVDHRADIYSVGVVFYEMLTGELPLGKFSPPSRKVHVDVRLDEVVLHALEKEPERRYQHASEVKTDVETITGKSESRYPKSHISARPRRLEWRSMLMVGAVLFSLLSVASVLGWLASDRSFSLPTCLGVVLAVTVVIIGFTAWLVNTIIRLFSPPLEPPSTRVVEPKPRSGWQPILAPLVLLATFAVWVLFGYWTYIQPILVERLRDQATPISAGQRFMFQSGSLAQTYDWFFVPLLVLTTVGSVLWLILSATGPQTLSWLREGLRSVRLSVTGILGPKEAPKPMGLTKLVSAARWTARIFGTLLFAFYGFFILNEGLPPIASQPEGVQLNFVALALMLLGFGVGWKRDGAAALLIVGGWTLWHISEGRMRWNVFQTPLPVAALYGFCWWATHGRRTRIVVMAVAALAVCLGLGRLFVPTSVSVRGVIIDTRSGKPIPNAELRILPRPPRSADNGDPPDARANADGEFTLYVGWYESYRGLAISATGYETVTTNLGPRNLGQRNVSRNFQLQPTLHSVDAGDIPVPPVVVSTVPESGAADVDPGLEELRVTFSEPMQDGGWSWTKWTDDSFPETRGQARFLEDGRTCVLPVQLQRGKVYAIWINSEHHQNFKDRHSLPAVPYLLIFETRK